MATNTQGVIKMPKTKTLEEKLINDHEAKKNLPEILKHAIAQADYLEEVEGNQIVANRISGVESILTPLAYQVYTVAIYAHDILWSLNDLSDAVESMPLMSISGEKLIEETKKQHQKMYEDNHEIFYAAREWMIDYYIEAYMTLMD